MRYDTKTNLKIDTIRFGLAKLAFQLIFLLTSPVKKKKEKKRNRANNCLKSKILER